MASPDEVRTIRVSGWIDQAPLSAGRLSDPSADAGGSDLITDVVGLGLCQSHALVIRRNPKMVLDSYLYDLVPFLAGDRMFAVVAEQVEGTAEAKKPAALPLGPASVLGVVCVRGRMLTVLDPVAIITGESHDWPTILPRVIALRGDQQLALAAQECHDTITLAAADIQRTTKSGDDSSAQALMGIARHGGEEIAILNIDQLFAGIPWRRERRRRRF